MSALKGLLARLGQERDLLKLISSSFAVRGFGVASGFVMHIVLSRTLGSEGAGIFYLALTLMMAGGVIGKFGLDTALMRFAGTAAAAGDMARVRGIYAQACLLSAGLSIIGTGVLALSAPWLAATLFDNLALEPVIVVLALAVCPFSLIWVQSGVLKAVGRPAAATLVESALLPALMGIAVVLLATNDHVTPERAGICYLLATLVVSGIGAWMFRGGEGGRGPRDRMEMAELTRVCSPLALIDMMNFLMAWAIIPILGSVAPEAEVGIFNAAHRLTIQISMVLVIFGGIMAPRFAALYAQGQIAALEKLVANTTLYMSLAALPFGALFLLWPQVVGLIFGAEFAAADDILRVLTVGQLINLMTGPAGYVLVMTGHQRTMRNILSGTLLVVLPLTWLMARSYGGIGAAAATAAGLAIQNLLALWAVYRHLGIIGLPLLRQRHNELEEE